MKHKPGPPMTLANMREQGVHHLIDVRRPPMSEPALKPVLESRLKTHPV